jgi:hypothetical protein
MEPLQAAIEVIVKPGHNVVTRSFAKNRPTTPGRVGRACAMAMCWRPTGHMPTALNVRPMPGRSGGCEAHADGPVECGRQVPARAVFEAEVMLQRQLVTARMMGAEVVAAV